jgi:hypothetical protein
VEIITFVLKSLKEQFNEISLIKAGSEVEGYAVSCDAISPISLKMMYWFCKNIVDLG